MSERDYRDCVRENLDREDMLELTRRMTAARSCFTRIAGCYLDADGEIDNTFNVNFLNLSPKDKTANLALAKAVPFADTNVRLKEYVFPKEAMRPGSMWQLLGGIHACGLKNDMLMEVLYEQIAAAFRSSHSYAIDVFHGTYDVPVKTKDNEYTRESEEVYDFIICTIGRTDEDYCVEKPVFGFMYPAFSGRSADPSAIDIFNADPDNPEEELMRRLLGFA